LEYMMLFSSEVKDYFLSVEPVVLHVFSLNLWYR